MLDKAPVLQHDEERSRHRRGITGEHRIDPPGARRDLPNAKEEGNEADLPCLNNKRAMAQPTQIFPVGRALRDSRR